MAAKNSDPKEVSMRQTRTHGGASSRSGQGLMHLEELPPEAVAARWDGFFLEARRLAALSRERKQKNTLPELRFPGE
jgi:hypothetical protein